MSAPCSTSPAQAESGHSLQSPAATGCPAASSRPRRSSSSLADLCERLSRAVAPCLVPRQMHQRSATLSVPMIACRTPSVSAALRKRSDTHSQSSDPGGSCDESADCQALLVALMKAFSPRHSRARSTCVSTLARGVVRRPGEIPVFGPRGLRSLAPAPAQRRSLREVMPSLLKTLPRCHSTVRGLMNI
jgi:hypothetical protein